MSMAAAITIGRRLVGKTPYALFVLAFISSLVSFFPAISGTVVGFKLVFASFALIILGIGIAPVCFWLEQDE